MRQVEENQETITIRRESEDKQETKKGKDDNPLELSVWSAGGGDWTLGGEHRSTRTQY